MDGRTDASLGSLRSSQSFEANVAFEEQAQRTVDRFLLSIQGTLYSDLGTEAPKTRRASRYDTSSATSYVDECREWASSFPHIRLCGTSVCKRPPLVGAKAGSSDTAPPSTGDSTGKSPQPVPSTNSTASVPDATATGVELDQSMAVSGVQINIRAVESNEEIIAKDGNVEEILACDYSDAPYSSLAPAGLSEAFVARKARRRERQGFPPLTPERCKRFEAAASAFDRVWREDMVELLQPLVELSVAHVYNQTATPSTPDSSPAHGAQPPSTRSSGRSNPATSNSYESVVFHASQHSGRQSTQQLSPSVRQAYNADVSGSSLALFAGLDSRDSPNSSARKWRESSHSDRFSSPSTSRSSSAAVRRRATTRPGTADSTYSDVTLPRSPAHPSSPTPSPAQHDYAPQAVQKPRGATSTDSSPVRSGASNATRKGSAGRTSGGGGDGHRKVPPRPYTAGGMGAEVGTAVRHPTGGFDLQSAIVIRKVHVGRSNGPAATSSATTGSVGGQHGNRRGSAQSLRELMRSSSTQALRTTVYVQPHTVLEDKDYNYDDEEFLDSVDSPSLGSPSDSPWHSSTRTSTSGQPRASPPRGKTADAGSRHRSSQSLNFKISGRNVFPTQQTPGHSRTSQSDTYEIASEHYSQQQPQQLQYRAARWGGGGQGSSTSTQPQGLPTVQGVGMAIQNGNSVGSPRLLAASRNKSLQPSRVQQGLRYQGQDYVGPGSADDPNAYAADSEWFGQTPGSPPNGGPLQSQAPLNMAQLAVQRIPRPSTTTGSGRGSRGSVAAADRSTGGGRQGRTSGGTTNRRNRRGKHSGSLSSGAMGGRHRPQSHYGLRLRSQQPQQYAQAQAARHDSSNRASPSPSYTVQGYRWRTRELARARTPRKEKRAQSGSARRSSIGALYTSSLSASMGGPSTGGGVSGSYPDLSSPVTPFAPQFIVAPAGASPSFLPYIHMHRAVSDPTMVNGDPTRVGSTDTDLRESVRLPELPSRRLFSPTVRV